MRKEDILLITGQTELNLYRILFVTKLSMMKVVDGGEFDVNKRTVMASKLQDDDSLVSVTLYQDQKHIILQTKEGYFLRFQIDEIPEKKKAALGVRGMKLSKDDYIEGVYYTTSVSSGTIALKDKSIDLSRIKAAKRDGKGTKIRL